MRRTKHKETKHTLPTHILEVLKENEKNGNPFLTDSQIAIRVNTRILHDYPEDKYADKQIQAKTIKSNMGPARLLADFDGRTIVADRKMASSKGDPLDGWIILGWRLADEDDAEYIRKEIEIRAKRGNGYSGNATKIKETAQKQGLLPPEKETAAIEE